MTIKKEDIPYELHTMVDIIGWENFLDICKMYGGTLVYIPVYRKVVMGQRNRDIAKEYNGKNLDKLRIKYGISKTQLKQLLKDVKR